MCGGARWQSWHFYELSTDWLEQHLVPATARSETDQSSYFWSPEQETIKSRQSIKHNWITSSAKSTISPTYFSQLLHWATLGPDEGENCNITCATVENLWRTDFIQRCNGTPITLTFSLESRKWCRAITAITLYMPGDCEGYQWCWEYWPIGRIGRFEFTATWKAPFLKGSISMLLSPFLDNKNWSYLMIWQKLLFSNSAHCTLCLQGISTTWYFPPSDFHLLSWASTPLAEDLT